MCNVATAIRLSGNANSAIQSSNRSDIGDFWFSQWINDGKTWKLGFRDFRGWSTRLRCSFCVFKSGSAEIRHPNSESRHFWFTHPLDIEKSYKLGFRDYQRCWLRIWYLCSDLITFNQSIINSSISMILEQSENCKNWDLQVPICRFDCAD